MTDADLELTRKMRGATWPADNYGLTDDQLAWLDELACVDLIGKHDEDEPWIAQVLALADSMRANIKEKCAERDKLRDLLIRWQTIEHFDEGAWLVDEIVEAVGDHFSQSSKNVLPDAQAIIAIAAERDAMRYKLEQMQENAGRICSFGPCEIQIGQGVGPDGYAWHWSIALHDGHTYTLGDVRGELADVIADMTTHAPALVERLKAFYAEFGGWPRKGDEDSGATQPT